VDGTALRLPASRWLEADERQIPTGRQVPVDGTPYDFRLPRPLGSTTMDVALTGLARDEDGLARVELRAPGGERRVTVWLDHGFEYLMAFTGDTLQPGRRRRGLAVEPMTCAPDAFHNRLGLKVLEPGQRTSATWGITVAG
jgi:aldose 1-epimerase